MNMKNKQVFIGGLAGALTALILFFAVWPALAGNDAPIQSAPQNFGENEKLVVIPAAAFVSDGFLPDSFFFPFGGGYFQGNGSNYGCMEAPVYVPAGRNLLRMYASVYDNDPTRSISIALRRVDNFGGGTTNMASVSTSSADVFNGVQILSDTSVIEQSVAFPDYSYYITTCLGSSDIRLYSVRLYIVADQYLPSMQR
jgi:hypothetical protein